MGLYNFHGFFLSTFVFVQMPHSTRMVKNEPIIKHYEFAEFYFSNLLISLDTHTILIAYQLLCLKTLVRTDTENIYWNGLVHRHKTAKLQKVFEKRTVLKHFRFDIPPHRHLLNVPKTSSIFCTACIAHIYPFITFKHCLNLLGFFEVKSDLQVHFFEILENMQFFLGSSRWDLPKFFLSRLPLKFFGVRTYAET